jgi:hypothetical protein
MGFFYIAAFGARDRSLGASWSRRRPDGGTGRSGRPLRAYPFERSDFRKEAGMSPRSARRLIATTIAFALLLLNGTQARSDDTIETIVLVRHGEKPDTGLGQLDCQGLNRALALPHVIAKTFGRPSAAFAPDPSQQMQDHGVLFDYVRPLATIEPTAIFFGLPVNASFGFSNIDGLQAAVEQPIYRNALVLIAWEHRLIETIAQKLLTAHRGNASVVPKWQGDDFDSIYVVTITAAGGAARASFAHEHEGLDGQPNTCPH